MSPSIEHEGPPRRRRRRVLVAVLLASVAAVVLARQDRSPGPGPLRAVDFRDPTVESSFTTVHGRRAVTWRRVVVTNPADHPMVLRRVALVDAGGLRVADARVAGTGRPRASGLARSWPPSGPAIRRFEGAVVPPRSRAGLRLYLRVVPAEDALRPIGDPRVGSTASTPGVRVTYVFDGRTYTATVAEGLVVCERASSCGEVLRPLPG